MKTLILTSFILCVALQAANSINTPMSIVPSTGHLTVLQSKSDRELAWVDEQIKAIIPVRIGVSDGYINSLNDPIKYKSSAPMATGISTNLLAPPKLGSFPMLLTPPKVVEEPLRLQALMNKSALINGTWYRLNDAVRSYRLVDIKATSILLSGAKGQNLILFITKQNNDIKINTK